MRIGCVIICVAAWVGISLTVAESPYLFLSHQGTLVWTNLSNTLCARLEWSSEAQGPWSSFDQLLSLDSIYSTAQVHHVKVPMFYRLAQDNQAVENGVLGTYQYMAYDTNHTLLVVGWLMVNNITNGASGTWKLGAVNAELIGKIGSNHMKGEGLFKGTVNDQGISIYLNPGVADYNLRIFGTQENNGYKGEWWGITFGGPTSRGEFVMKKAIILP